MYCGPCGKQHRGPVNDNCRKSNMPKTRGGAREVEKQGATSESSTEFVKEEADQKEDQTIGQRTETSDEDLDERERDIAERERVQARRRRKADLDRRERRLGEETSDSAAKRRRGRSRSRSRGGSGDRRQRRRHHRASSSSSSDGRTTSRDRKQRSKWSIRRYLEDRKDLKKLSPFELIESSCGWVLDKKDLDLQDLRRFVKHIKYMSGKAKSGRFLDQAHASYDLAIRKLAVTDGYDAFCAGNPELALRYYAFESMRTQNAKSSASGSKYGQSSTKHLFCKDGKKPCFPHNKDDGCSRDEKTCNFGHWCSRCGSKSHIRPNCRKE